MKEEITQRVEEKISFYLHGFVFLMVNLALTIVNFVFTPQHLWFFYPLFGWGIGLFSHFIGVFPPKFFTSIKQKMIQNEIKKAEKD